MRENLYILVHFFRGMWLKWFDPFFVNLDCGLFYEVRSVQIFRSFQALFSNIFLLCSSVISSSLTLFNISLVQRSPFSVPKG